MSLQAVRFGGTSQCTSMHSIFGRGLYLGDVSFDSMRNYVENNRDLLKKSYEKSGLKSEEIETWIEKFMAYDSFDNMYLDKSEDDFFTDGISYEISYKSLITRIATEKYNIRFEIQYDYTADLEPEDREEDINEPYLIFLIREPWSYTQREKDLTEEDLTAILNEIAEDLDINRPDNTYLELFWME